jgi:hypothetical protein
MAKVPPPDWAYHSVKADEREGALQAHQAGRMRTNWEEAKDLKGWAKKQGWPTPWLNFESKFYETMLASDANFGLAVTKSGLQISIPKKEHTITASDLAGYDAQYEDPQSWRWLVEDLREVRRAVEVGVVVRVEDKELNSFDSFYSWAHGRYHALEDGADEWVGMD